MGRLLESISSKSLRTVLEECVPAPCEQIWHIFGSVLQLYEIAKRLTIDPILKLAQVTILLIDVAIVSYAGALS